MSDEHKLPGVPIFAWLSFFVTTLFSIALNLVLHANVRSSVVSRYPNDSFYTLDTSAAIGLSVISCLLLLVVLLVSWVFTQFLIKQIHDYAVVYRAAIFFINAAVLVVVYLLLLIFSPQIYYSYYQLVFNDLPTQWVIQSIALTQLLNIVSLPTGSSMANHLAGFTLWVLLCNLAIQYLTTHTRTTRIKRWFK